MPAVRSKIAARAVNLRMREEVRALIDTAARLRGASRSEFMIAAARRAAEEAILDRAVISVDAATFRRYQDMLDRPPPAEALARLMAKRPPWVP
jgi:uncharacterized protein (DUF1778 family)